MTFTLLQQMFVAAPLFSGLNSLQMAVTAKQRRNVAISKVIIVLGYWRSGTTLLHNYLCLDKRFGFPSTYACMNPQHFVLTQKTALQRTAVAVKRPMDDMQIVPSSPQEDEFGLLALGARSPYEALFAPSRLAATLALGDPFDLPPDERKQWRRTFNDFLTGVSMVEGGRPLILKSPTHCYRIGLLREILPDAKFVLIVRSPDVVYESTIRMWRALFHTYAMSPLPPEEDTRRIVLEERPHFEAKLASGLAGLSQDRLMVVHYEALVASPLAVMKEIYQRLDITEFSQIEANIAIEASRHAPYKARNARPPKYWADEVKVKWRGIFEKYGYAVR